MELAAAADATNPPMTKATEGKKGSGGRRPVIGQVVYIGSLDSEELEPAEVKKVGRQYFYVLTEEAKRWCSDPAHEQYYLRQFRIEDWGGGERNHYDAFENEGHRQELRAARELRREKSKLADQIARLNSWQTEKLTLDQLRRIKAILEETAPPQTTD